MFHKKIRYNHFTYNEEENEFSCASCDFHSNRDCVYTLELLEDIDYAMSEAVRVIQDKIDKWKEKDKILGIGKFYNG